MLQVPSPAALILPAIALMTGLGCHDSDPGTALSSRPRDSAAALSYLASELNVGRPVEPRLSLELRYVPCRKASPNDPDVPSEPDCPGAGGPFEELFRIPESEGWHDAAVDLEAQALLYLVAGRDHVAAGNAVRRLENARARGARAPRLLSDLAAAYYVRAQRRHAPLDLVRALACAEEATRLSGSLPQARFNKALALEELGLRRAAVESWREYLALDKRTEWAREARQRMRAAQPDDAAESWPQTATLLEQAAIRGDLATLRALIPRRRLAVRLHVEEKLLPRWAQAYWEDRKEEASTWLRAARFVAGELAADRGGHLLADAVATIDRCLEAPDAPTCAQGLAVGHLSYGKGIELYGRFHLDAAQEHFQDAREALAKSRSPLSLWAELFLAICAYQRFDYPVALESIAALEVEANRRGYGSLAGRADWIAGLCHLAAARPLEALKAFRASLDAFRRLGEEASVISIHARLADTLRNMGSNEKAWQHLYPALRGLPQLHRLHRKHLVLGEAALGAMAIGEPVAAQFFQDEAVHLSKRSGNELELAYALLGRAAIHVAARNPQRAMPDLQAADRSARGRLDDNLRQALQGKIREVEGQLWRETDAERSIAALTSALETFRETRFRVQLAAVYFHRALTYRSIGRHAEAEADFRSAIAEVELEWQDVLKPPDGGGESLPEYFDYRRKIFEEMISLLVDLDRWDEALEYAERSRARELLDLVADAGNLPAGADPGLVKPEVPLRAKELQRAIPDETALVEYAVTGHRLLIWVLRRGQYRFVAAGTGRREIEVLVDLVHAGMKGEVPERDLFAGLQSLYEILLAPVLSLVAEGETIVFVPDESLHWVPFAALLDPESGRYLIERNVLAIAPSGTLYAHALRRTRELAGTGEAVNALVVGAPTFDRAAFPDLPPLPAADFEAKEVASLYHDATLLRQERATKSRFLRALGRHEVVHVASHTLLNPEAPFLSALILAPEAGGASGALYAHELLSRHFGRTRLIVLSGCSTAGGPRTGVQGVTGFVRPLLGAGVPTVVASLWDVYDRATARLFAVFHRGVREGDDPAHALRTAQLELLRSPNQILNPVSKWAAFEVIGAASPEPAARRAQTIGAPGEGE